MLKMICHRIQATATELWQLVVHWSSERTRSEANANASKRKQRASARSQTRNIPKDPCLRFPHGNRIHRDPIRSWRVRRPGSTSLSPPLPPSPAAPTPSRPPASFTEPVRSGRKAKATHACACLHQQLFLFLEHGAGRPWKEGGLVICKLN